MARLSASALPGGAALLALGWGSNQFAPLVVGYQVAAGVSAAATETMFVLYAVGLVPGLFAGGQMSDRFGRRVLILASLALSAVSSLLLMAGGASVAPLYAGRLLVGLASGIGFSAGTAWVKEESHAHHGARHAVIAMTAGFGLGPLVAGAVGAAAPHRLWLSYLPHLAITLAALLMVARSGAGRAVRPTMVRGDAQSGTLTSEPTFWRVIVPLAPWVFLSASVALATLPAAVPSKAVGGPLWSAALITPLPAIAGVAVQSMVSRMPRLRGQVAAGLATATIGLACGALAVATGSFLLVLLACILLGLAYGICQTGGLHAVTTLSASDRLGQSTAIYQALTYVGYLAPLPIVALTQLTSLTTVLAVLAVLAVLTAAAVLPSTTRVEKHVARAEHAERV